MRAVTDSGPLIALAKIGAVSLLPQVYTDVAAPAAVADEVLSDTFPDAAPIALAMRRGEIRVVPVLDAELSYDLATAPLGRGEKQAIHLASRERVDVVLIDDAEARANAKARGLHVKGTLGVIVAAVRTGILPVKDAERLMEMIQLRPDIWITDSVCLAVLEALRQ